MLVCHDKQTSILLLRQTHDKQNFVATKVLSRQAYSCHNERRVLSGQTHVCRDKHVFVTTRLLSQQKLYSWQLPPMIVNVPDPIHIQSRSAQKHWPKAGRMIFAYQFASGPEPLGGSLTQSARTKRDPGWFSRCEPGHLWKNVTEFESGKHVCMVVVAG